MSETKRVTVRANRVRITENCRTMTGAITGNMDAFDRAVEMLRRSYVQLTSSPVHDIGKGSEFLLDLSVEYDR